jgi:hypothetical protein
MVFWFAGDLGVTQVSGAISKWADQSGHAADAAQAVAGLRPKQANFNGLSVVEFDGDDDYLVMPNLAGDFTNGASFFAVTRPTIDSPCMGVVELSNGPEIADVSFTDQGQTLAYEVFNQSMASPVGGLVPNEVRLVEVVHTTDQIASIWLDDVSAAQMSDMLLPELVARTQDFVGRSLYADCGTFSGQLMEVMLYARAVSDTERQVIEGYLQTKWGCCKV